MYNCVKSTKIDHNDSKLYGFILKSTNGAETDFLTNFGENQVR
jgi:hypothetical protein